MGWPYELRGPIEGQGEDVLIERGEIRSVEETVLAIAQGILNQGQVPDGREGARLLVWERDWEGEREQAPAYVIHRAVSGVPDAWDSWNTCEHLKKIGAISGYGTRLDKAGDYHCFLETYEGGISYSYDPDAFDQVVGAFQDGWLAARYQEPSDTWAPWEAYAIGEYLASSTRTTCIAAIRALGGDAELEELLAWERRENIATGGREDWERRREIRSKALEGLTALRSRLEDAAGG